MIPGSAESKTNSIRKTDLRSIHVSPDGRVPSGQLDLIWSGAEEECPPGGKLRLAGSTGLSQRHTRH